MQLQAVLTWLVIDGALRWHIVAVFERKEHVVLSVTLIPWRQALPLINLER